MVVEQSSLVLNFLGSSWTVFLISWDSDIISTVPEHLVDWTPRRNIRSQLTVAANNVKNYSSNTRNPVVLRNHPRHHRYCFLDRNCTVYWMRWWPKSLQRSNASDSQKKIEFHPRLRNVVQEWKFLLCMLRARDRDTVVKTFRHESQWESRSRACDHSSRDMASCSRSGNQGGWVRALTITDISVHLPCSEDASNDYFLESESCEFILLNDISCQNWGTSSHN